MDVNLEQLTTTLNESADEIKEAADVASKNPLEAMSLVEPLMQRLKTLTSMGSVKDINASLKNAPNAQDVQDAIDHFLQNTKEAQEKVGEMGAALFSMPPFQELTRNLEQVKESLDRSKRVEEPEEGSGI